MDCPVSYLQRLAIDIHLEVATVQCTCESLDCRRLVLQDNIKLHRGCTPTTNACNGHNID